MSTTTAVTAPVTTLLTAIGSEKVTYSLNNKVVHT